MDLKVLSWNARSLRDNRTNHKLTELKFYLQTNFCHIILVQETWLDPKCNIYIPNYSCIRHDHTSNTNHPHGGVLIFVHSSIAFKQINFTNLQFSDAVFVRIFIGAKELVIGSVYCSPSLKCAERKSDYLKMISHSGPFVLAGDFNAKHTSWNNVKFDRSGCHLKKICDDNLCDIHFTNSPTAFPPTGS